MSNYRVGAMAYYVRGRTSDMRLFETELSPPAFGTAVAVSSFAVYLAVYAVAVAAGFVDTGLVDIVWRGTVISVVLGAVLAWDKGQRDTSGDTDDGDGPD